MTKYQCPEPAWCTFDNSPSTTNERKLPSRTSLTLLVNSETGDKVDELYTMPSQAVSKFHNNLAIDKNNNLLELSNIDYSEIENVDNFK